MKALIIVDMQNDFFPGGALPVATAPQVLPIFEKLLKYPFDVIVASKDWHPKDHASFASMHGKKPGQVVKLGDIEQMLWPDHCVQGSTGADFYPKWDASGVQKIFYKGTNKDVDSYSTFFDNQHLKSTGLADYLKENQVDTVYVAGLATDYCVKYSVLDALKLGFKTIVISDACRGVNLQSDDSDKAFKNMQQAGAVIITSDELLNS